MAPDQLGARRESESSRPTRATVTFDDGPVTILPRRAPVGNSAPIRGRPLAIFVGAPPRSLAAQPDTCFSAVVEPDGRPGFAIVDLSEPEAADLGRALGQVEILYWDGRRASLLPCGAE